MNSTGLIDNAVSAVLDYAISVFKKFFETIQEAKKTLCQGSMGV